MLDKNNEVYISILELCRVEKLDKAEGLTSKRTRDFQTLGQFVDSSFVSLKTKEIILSNGPVRLLRNKPGPHFAHHFGIEYVICERATGKIRLLGAAIVVQFKRQ
jgi:hypothetical protein